MLHTNVVFKIREVEKLTIVKDKLEKFCDGHEKRLIKLEGFAWFREWVSDLRNNLFKYVVLLAITGGIIYVIITHGHDILEKIFR